MKRNLCTFSKLVVLEDSSENDHRLKQYAQNKVFYSFWILTRQSSD